LELGGTDTSIISALKYVLIYKWDIQMKWCCNSWRVSVIHKVAAAALIHVIFVLWFGQKWHDICLVTLLLWSFSHQSHWYICWHC
jgi:hypothetical protein